MHAFLSNLANRQTDKRGQTHLPPPLSVVKTAVRLTTEQRTELLVLVHVAVFARGQH